MRFFRKKVVFILTLVMALSCIITGVLSVRLSIYRFNKLKSSGVSITAVSGKSTNKPFRGIPSRLEESLLYLNGQLYNGLKAYRSDSNDYYLPADSILELLNIKFDFYQSDDILSFKSGKQNITVKLGDSRFSAGRQKISVNGTAFRGYGHILVPMELFTHLKGFSASVGPPQNEASAFLNYRPGFDPKDFEALYFLQKGENGAYTYNPAKGRVWTGDRDSALEDNLFGFPGEAEKLVRSGGRIYLAGSGGRAEAFSIPAHATLSRDGRYLYWVDEKMRTSFVCNTSTKAVQELGDYCYRTGDSFKGRKFSGRLLYDYTSTRIFKRVALIDPDTGEIHIFIERYGKTAVDGIAVFSPDRKRIVYTRNGKTYTSYADGTGSRYLFQGTGAWWAGCWQVCYREKGRDYIYSWRDSSTSETKESMRTAGSFAQGSLFFSGNRLYLEKTGNNVELGRLPGPGSYAAGFNYPGLFIAASAQNGEVYAIYKGVVAKVGIYGMLLKKPGSAEVDFAQSVIFSPSGSSVALIQKEGARAVVYILNPDGKISSRFAIAAFMSGREEELHLEWLDENNILIWTPGKRWYAGLEPEVRLFQENLDGQNSIISRLK